MNPNSTPPWPPPGAPGPAVPGPGAAWPGLGGGRERLAEVLLVVGGLVAVLAFLTAPVLDVPILGSFTAPALVEVAAQSPGGGGLVLLWLLPLCAAAVIGCGGWLLTHPPTPAGTGRRGHGVAAGALAGAALGFGFYAVLGLLTHQQAQADRETSFGLSALESLAGGFWLVLLGMGVAITGAVLALASPPRWPVMPPTPPAASPGWLR